MWLLVFLSNNDNSININHLLAHINMVLLFNISNSIHQIFLFNIYDLHTAVLFQIIIIIIIIIVIIFSKWLNSSIWSIHEALTCTTNQGKSGPESIDIKRSLMLPDRSLIIRCSLVLYLEHSLGVRVSFLCWGYCRRILFPQLRGRQLVFSYPFKFQSHIDF